MPRGAFNQPVQGMQKLRAKITFCDPATRRIEGLIKGGAIVQIAVWELPIAFRWPQENEMWTILYSNGYWHLGQKVDYDEEKDVTTAIETLTPGDTRISAGGNIHLDGDVHVFGKLHTVGPNWDWKGEWKSNTAYAVNDLVQVDHEYYMAIKASTNIQTSDTSVWTHVLSAASGSSGSSTTVYWIGSGSSYDVQFLSEITNPVNGDIAIDNTNKKNYAYNGTTWREFVKPSMEITDVTGLTSALAAKQSVNQKDQPSGYAGLDGSGKIGSSALPLIAITSVFTVDSESAQVNLAAQEGDVAVRTDESKSYIKNNGTTGTISDWTLLRVPTGGGVSSVAYRTGDVVLTHADITDWSTALSSYVTSSALTTALADYVTSSSLTTTLASYVTSSSLTSTLASYVTSSSLTSTLASYVTSSSLSSTLVSYAALSGNQTFSGNNLFTGTVKIQNSGGGAIIKLGGQGGSAASETRIILSNGFPAYYDLIAGVSPTGSIYLMPDSGSGDDMKPFWVKRGDGWIQPSYTDHTHAYGSSSLTGFGTAAAKDVPATGNATSSQVVLGSDTRLTPQAAGTASIRSLGTTSTTATAGNDQRVNRSSITVTRSSSISVATGGFGANITFNSTDSTAGDTSLLTASSGYITVNTDCFVIASFYVNWPNTTTGYRTCGLQHKNSSGTNLTTDGAGMTSFIPQSHPFTSTTATATFKCASGDRIYGYVYHTSGSSLTISSGVSDLSLSVSIVTI